MALAPTVADRRRRLAWTLPASIAAAVQADTWRGDPQPQVTRQQPIGPGTVWLGRQMRLAQPALITTTFARGRTLAPGRPSSMHHTGRAIDLMVAEVAGGPNRAADAIANWLVAHSKEIGLQYLIWSGTQWSSATGRQSVYPGTEDHFNHLHLDLSVAGAAARLPWYANIDPLLVGGRSPETAPAGDATPAAEDPVADMTITPAEAAGAGDAAKAAGVVAAAGVLFGIGKKLRWW